MDENEEVVFITTAGWKTVKEKNLTAELARVSANEGLPAARRLLIREGVDFTLGQMPADA